MSFLFGKKDKHKDQAHGRAVPPSRDGHTTPGQGSLGQNGVKARSDATGQTPVQTPGRSINNSVSNSINEINGKTPSPDNGREKDGQLSEAREGGAEMQYGGPSRTALNGPPPQPANPAHLYPWSQRRLTFTSSQPNPFPRYGAAVNAVASKDGDVYLMGGLVNGTTVKGDLWMIEAGGGNLACYPVGTTFEGPGPRVGHASLLVGNAYIVFGGDTKMDDRDKLDDTLYLLNTSTRHWSRSMPPGRRPAGRYGHTLNILGSKIYVFGGQVEGYFFNDLVAFDLNALQAANSRWEILIENSNDGGPPEGQVPPARTNHTIVSWNDKLYLFGGTNGNQWFNDVWSYDPRAVAWTQLDCIGYIPAPREGHSAALVGDVMYIFGGRTEEGADLGDLAAFRITSRRWYTFQNMGPSPSPRSGHSMTAFGKQIVVLAGEPSSAPRDANELSLVYMLDTGKIRYPNDHQIQQTPTGERVPGNRRPSAERPAPQLRGPMPRDASRPGGDNPGGNNDGLRRKFSGSREDMANREAVQGMGPRGPDMSMMNGPPHGVLQGPPPGPGSRLPRSGASQSPAPGPPPQQQLPQQGPNGAIPAVGPSTTGSRSRTPTRNTRSPYGQHVDTTMADSYEKERSSPVVSPVAREGPGAVNNQRSVSPIMNGRRTPTTQQQSQKMMNPMVDSEEAQIMDPGGVRSRSRQAAPEDSYGDLENFPAPSAQQPQQPQQHREPSPFDDRPDESPPSRNYMQQESRNQESRNQGYRNQESRNVVHHDISSPEEIRQRNQLDELAAQQEALIGELEEARNRAAWFESELALAREAGYQPSSSQGSFLEHEKSFDDDDRPFVQALIAMKSQLAQVQGSVDARVNAAAQEVAVIEQQRDVAIREAAYAKAKLAAHGGGSSVANTPQSEGMARDVDHEDRSSDIGRKLAVALATQNELRTSIQAMTAELQSERQARELAEGTAEVAQKRAADFDQSYNPGEIESLRREMHETSVTARDLATQKTEAQSRLELLEVDKNDLSRRLDEALMNANQHSSTFASLRDAVSASDDKASLLERKLEEERGQRELLDQKLLQLRAEHEERTAELDATSRKLRDAEELVDTNANEARAHRTAVLEGLERLSTPSPDTQSDPTTEERVTLLKQQVEKAHGLMRQHQAETDAAAEKLRGAEERIAGLEAYQEQTSRESLNVRKQLQDAVREHNELRSKHNEVLQQLESHQRDTSALTVQHNALKELLDERGSTPRSQIDTPDQYRVKELEQQLEDSLRAHQETKSTSETRMQEADQSYREKLEQLEADYQSAVHYVKGTEKMLKRMKDELTKYKGENRDLRKELDTAERSRSERSMEPEAAAEWEQERQLLRQEIGEMQESVKDTVSQLERQMEEVQSELYEAQQQRDFYRHNNDKAQQQMSQLQQQARAELEQLKSENSMLEGRAVDAEQKVTLLLDQVGTSVTNYRRQSQQMTNGHHHNHSRNQSSISTMGPSRGAAPSASASSHGASDSVSTDTTFTIGNSPTDPINNRNSVALDSLASELETLRTHWEGTHRNYRMSNQFDFERTPTSVSATGGNNSASNEGMLSDSLASWRRRLEQEEREKGQVRGGDGSDDDDEGSGGGGGLEGGYRGGPRPGLKSNESEVTGLTRGMPGTLRDESSDDEEDVRRGQGQGVGGGMGGGGRNII